MRDFIVVSWHYDESVRPHSSITEYKDFDELEEAIEYADQRAKELKEDGVEYDVSIYERTKY